MYTSFSPKSKHTKNLNKFLGGTQVLLLKVIGESVLNNCKRRE